MNNMNNIKKDSIIVLIRLIGIFWIYYKNYTNMIWLYFNYVTGKLCDVMSLFRRILTTYVQTEEEVKVRKGHIFSKSYV